MGGQIPNQVRDDGLSVRDDGLSVRMSGFLFGMTGLAVRDDSFVSLGCQACLPTFMPVKCYRFVLYCNNFKYFR